MKFVSWIIGVPLAVVVVTFAIANRGLVKIELWPLPFIVDMPIYLMALAPLVLGFALGAVAMWLSAGRLRARVRERSYQVRTLEAEAEELRRRLPVVVADQAA